MLLWCVLISCLRLPACFIVLFSHGVLLMQVRFVKADEVREEYFTPETTPESFRKWVVLYSTFCSINASSKGMIKMSFWSLIECIKDEEFSQVVSSNAFVVSFCVNEITRNLGVISSWCKIWQQNWAVDYRAISVELSELTHKWPTIYNTFSCCHLSGIITVNSFSSSLPSWKELT